MSDKNNSKLPEKILADRAVISNQLSSIDKTELRILELQQLMASEQAKLAQAKAYIAEWINNIIINTESTISNEAGLQEVLGLERNAEIFWGGGHTSLVYSRDPNYMIINNQKYPFMYILEQIDLLSKDDFFQVLFFGWDLKLVHKFDEVEKQKNTKNRYDSFFDESDEIGDIGTNDLIISDEIDDTSEVYKEKIIGLLIQYILIHPDFYTISDEKIDQMEKFIHGTDQRILQKYILDELSLTSADIFEKARNKFFWKR